MNPYSKLINPALSNFNKESAFTIYPNPTAAGIKLFYDAVIHQNIRIKLLKYTGEVLAHFNGQLQDINTGLMHDTLQLKSGIYLVKVISQQQETTLSFVKL